MSNVYFQHSTLSCLPCLCLRYRWAFVPEVNVTHYSGPETALIESEQDCTPHVVRILEGIQQRYGVREPLTRKQTNTFIVCIEPKAARKSNKQEKQRNFFSQICMVHRGSHIIWDFFIWIWLLVVVKHLRLHFANERCYINKIGFYFEGTPEIKQSPSLLLLIRFPSPSYCLLGNYFIFSSVNNCHLTLNCNVMPSAIDYRGQ